MTHRDDYSLDLLRKSPKEVYEYADYVLQYVKEVDQRPISVEIKRIQSQYHIDHYYITRKRKKIGVVKIFQGNYFYLGLDDKRVNEDEYIPVIEKIEEYLGGWRINKIEATVHASFLDAFKLLGYQVDFSRIKMVLDLKNAKNLSEMTDVITRTYEKNDLSHIIDMTSDAYRGSVDEHVGVFSGGMASSAISSILNGNYGDFRSDLTPVIVSEGSSYIEAASMTTISEGNPFVVLIGVRRAEQGKGYGRALLSWVINKTKEEGYDQLRLWVTVGNDAALNLYRTVGFKEITQIYSIYRLL